MDSTTKQVRELILIVQLRSVAMNAKLRGMKKFLKMGSGSPRAGHPLQLAEFYGCKWGTQR
jgi:hypothetical protein